MHRRCGRTAVFLKDDFLYQVGRKGLGARDNKRAREVGVMEKERWGYGGKKKETGSCGDEITGLRG